MFRRHVLFASLAAATLCAARAFAADADDAVVVTATRLPQSGFDLPIAIDVVDKRRISEQTPRTAISETLNRLPGTLVQNRETLAQEQQITLRGFGARSQFGVRGIKLIADGIPAGTPDGQGGAGLFDLASAGRIEVLRGPFSALYGNHSGGVIQVSTENGPKRPELSADLLAGSHGGRRVMAKFAGDWDGVNAVLSASRWDSDGYRDWSGGRKDQMNVKLLLDGGKGTTLTLLANRLKQPDNRDPLGLTAAQVMQDRSQANPAALANRTRRTLDNTQFGAVLEHALDGGHSLRALLYGGERNNEQYLAFPGGGATSSGGVSAFARDFWGSGLRWTRKSETLTLSAGVDYERADDQRRGYVNNGGVRGALRRDEDNAVWQRGAYLQAEWRAARDWTLHGGLRHSRVSFDSRDHYIVGANPDDSGSVAFSAWTPAAGVLFRLNERVNLYASAGRSFEAPTFIELAYRADGTSGLNLQLRPSISRHGEIGAKAYVTDALRLTAALFRIDTQDEIVVDTNVGGRTTYRNAGDTRRNGLELALSGELGGGFSMTLAATWLDARFRDAFAGSGGAVASGNRIPGLPARSAFAELAWRHPASGFAAAVEGRWASRIAVNDVNSESTDGYFVAGLRGGFVQTHGAWRFEEFLRIDNLFDRKYIGAVYVNDGNGRYYAPAAGRDYLAGIGVTRRF